MGADCGRLPGDSRLLAVTSLAVQNESILFDTHARSVSTLWIAQHWSQARRHSLSFKDDDDGTNGIIAASSPLCMAAETEGRVDWDE